MLLKNSVKGEDASYLHSKLNEYMPHDVLEIGSGPGLFSKMLFDHSSVKSLTINDINPQFIQFVKLCFDQEENNFKKFNSILGDIRNSDLKNKFDMIVIISSLHHIPYRVSLFQKMESMLKDQGVLIICEPVHNLLRLYHLLKKLKIFLRKEFMSDTSNYSTHHMCSKREYIGILKQCKYLKIEDLVYGKIPPRFSSTILLNSSFFRKKLATRIFTTFRKKST